MSTKELIPQDHERAKRLHSDSDEIDAAMLDAELADGQEMEL